MAEFVRICPRCGRPNPEYENLCAACDQFIGMEPAVAAPAPAPTGGDDGAGADGADTPATRRYTPLAESFFLRLESADLLLTVRPGSVLGQAHPTSDADLQVPDAVEGSDFLHRRHCRFEREAQRWTVTALDQSAYGSEFTNPTFVNQHRLAAGATHPLQDGDELRLSGLTFVVRMV
jgi:pSer/pThr/pTyr-binding forkhead associated (FHA) protein